MTIHHVSGRPDVDVIRWAARQSDPDRGVVAVIAPPQMSTLAPVAIAILAATGLDAGPDARIRAAAEVAEFAIARLRALRTELVIVARTEWIPDAIVPDVARFLELCAPEVWLLDDGHPRANDPFIDLGEDVHWTSLVDAIGACLARGPTLDRSQDAPLPPVLGRSARVKVPLVRKATSPEFLLAFSRAQAGLSRQVPTERIATQIAHRWLESVIDPGQFVHALLGLNLAFSTRGICLLVDPALVPGVRPLLAPEQRGRPKWRALRARMDPLYAATATLGAHGLDAAQIKGVAIRDVTPDGAFVVIDGAPRPIEVAARAYLVAHRYRRAAETDDPLEAFIADRGKPMTSRQIAIVLAAALEVVGITIDPDAFTHRLPPSVEWLDERGITVLMR